MKNVSRVILFSLVCLPFLDSTARSQVLNIVLDGLDGSASPLGGGQFPAIDVNGLLGPRGAAIFFDPADIGLWRNSGIPGANRGTIDLGQGTFALNWGASVAFEVFDSTGQRQIGMADILEVLRETGTFDPGSLLGTSQTPGPVPAILNLRDLAGRNVLQGPITINNKNSFRLAPDGMGGFGGLFLPGGGPEITVVLPPELGGGALLADLTGTFHLIPEPASLSLLGLGLLLVSRCRR